MGVCRMAKRLLAMSQDCNRVSVFGHVLMKSIISAMMTEERQ